MELHDQAEAVAEIVAVIVRGILKRPTSGKIRGRAHPCFQRHCWTTGPQARFADGLYLGNDSIAAWRAFACAIGSCPPPSSPAASTGQHGCSPCLATAARYSTTIRTSPSTPPTGRRLRATS